MKKTIKKTIISISCIMLALIMTTGVFSVVIVAADEKEDENIEYMEEIPFELELEEGDLSLKELAEAKLDEKDLPEYISWDMVESKGHVNRLYAQEPDEYTVMFQNRDASKSIYVFSFPVNEAKQSLTGQTMSQGIPESEPLFTMNKRKINFFKENILTSRLDKNSEDHKLYYYNIGIADIVAFDEMTGESAVNAPVYDITDDARKWTKEEIIVGTNTGADISMQISEPVPDGGTDAILPEEPRYVMLSITYSDIAGVNYIKNNSSLNFLAHAYEHDTRIMWYSNININNNDVVNAKWLFEYAGSTRFMISPVTNLSLKISYSNDYSQFGLNQSKIVLYLNYSSSLSDVLIQPASSLSYAMNSSFSLTYSSSTFPQNCHWSLTNHETYVPVEDICLDNIIYSNGYLTENFASVYPNNATAYRLAWFDEDGEILETEEEDDESYLLDGPGVYHVYCMDLYSGVESVLITVSVSDYYITTKYTYAIQPYSNSSKYMTMEMNDGVNNTLSVTGRNHGGSVSADYYKWTDYSQSFVVENTNNGGYNIEATLATNQYAVPNGNITGNEYTGDPYYLTTIDQKANYLSANSNNTVEFHLKDVGQQSWGIENHGTYRIIYCGASIVNNQITWYALKYTSSGVVVAAYDPADSNFKWVFSTIGLNVPLIMQTRKYYCGLATSLQIFYGAGKNIDDFGDSLDEQMQNYDEYLGFISTSGVYDWEFKNHLNNFFAFSTGGYDNKAINRTGYPCQATQNQTRQYIKNSLNFGYSPAFLTTSGYPYKLSNNGSAHYICIIGYDEINDYVIISNCHYNSSVFGIYAIKFTSFYSNINILYYYQ